MSPAFQTFSLHSGRDQSVELYFTDKDTGEALDLTGGVVRFSAELGNDDGDGEDVLEKASDEGTVDLLDQTQAATRGRARVRFVPADTAELDQQVLEWEAVAVDLYGQTHPGPYGSATVLSNVAP